jgi:N-acetylglutamate synthase-like GNAT family acetyltransferase
MGEFEIRILEPGDEAALEAFLLPRLDSSMFLIGNSRASGLRDGGQTYEGTYAAAFEGGRITGVVAHYWNRNLVFQAPSHLSVLWRTAVSASRRSIGGLIGPRGQVAVAKVELAIDESRVQMDETEKLYSLDLDELVVPDDLSSGRVSGRRANLGDIGLLTEWRVGYAVEAIGAEESDGLWEESRVMVERGVREGHTWLLEKDGQSVACSSFNTAIEEAVQVGGVWTPPGLRQRGYGRCAVAVSLLDARSEGVEKAMLFTGEENIAAQKAYVALGFRHVGDYRILLLRVPVEVE